MISRWCARSRTLHREGYFRDLAILFGLVTLALALLVKPDPFDLTRPAVYRQDGLSHALLVKTVMEVGWYPVQTPYLGAPFGVAIYDYPFVDGLNFLMIRVIGMFSDDWVTVLGLFYLAGFYLAAATGYVVMRKLRISSPWAIAGAFLFTFLPYHVLRRAHLLLASYAVVPLGVLLAHHAWRGKRARSTPARIARVLTVIAVGSGGAYYAAFSMFLVAVAGSARALASRSWRGGSTAILIVLGLCVVVVANVSPSLAYWAAQGTNPQVAVRPPSDSERYGLRLIQLAMPVAEHRVDALAGMAKSYGALAPEVNENAMSSLGFAGTLGLGVLAVVALARLGGASLGPPVLVFAATMGLAAFLLGTMGGVGALLAYTVSPIIRAYNRISVVLGFISITALMVALMTWVVPGRRSLRAWPVAAAIMLLGVLDQVPGGPARALDTTFASDRAFVRAAEAKLPAGTMVLQLPYQVFPDGAPVERMGLYGPLRGYLNSTSLRWSYAAMQGREGDRWIRALSNLRPDDAIDRAARSGFGAVYVDRQGFADRGAALESVLRKSLGAPIAESADGTLAMYRMEPKGTTPLTLDEVVPIDRTIRFDAQTLPPLVTKVSGVSTPEAWGRWTLGPVASFTLARDLPSRFVLRIETMNAMPTSTGVDLVARVDGVERPFRVGAGPTVVELPFEHVGKTDRLEIVIPDPRSPQEIGMNADPRKLGIGLRSITIVSKP